MERAHQNYKESAKDYKELLIREFQEKTKKESFFTYVEQRTSRAQKKEVCTDLLKILDLPGFPLGLKESDLPVRYPKPREEKEAIINFEGDFTHGEQYALFQMSRNLDSFLDRCNAQLNPGNTSPGPRIGSYAVLIYSYNVMCVRCAQSTIIDFVHAGGDQSSDPYEAFNTTIARKLTQGKTPPAAFIAGYTLPYKSETYSFPIDRFEQSMYVPIDFSTSASQNTVPLLSLEAQDQTFIPRQFCTPEETPQMIYHVALDPNV